MHRAAMRSVTFYSVMLLALVALVTKAHAEVLPDGLSSQVGHNSEALLFAILVALEIQFLRPVLLDSSWKWPVAFGLAGVLFAIAYGLLQTGWNASVVTLNESIVAAGFILPYIMIRRPFRLAPLVFLLILAFVVLFFDTDFVLDQAESLVPFMLAPLALDVFDRTILDSEQVDRPVLRLVWIAALVAMIVGFMAAATWARKDLQGPLPLGVDYGQRAAEAYWGWILVHGYFSYWLRGARGTLVVGKHSAAPASVEGA